jgi:hypothetical protein
MSLIPTRDGMRPSEDVCQCGHQRDQHSIVLWACRGRDSYSVRCTCPAFVLEPNEDHYEPEPAAVEDGWRGRPTRWVGGIDDDHWDGTL